MTPRLRFAPSPTGYLHVGGARTALFNWLYARKYGGQFLLRIEDTDRARSTEESTRAIFEGLTWLGLDWDEEVVYQGANLQRHQRDARRLVETGHAYRDFTPPEELDRLRKEAEARGEVFRFDRRLAELPDDEVERRLARGEPYAIRFRVPEGTTSWDDLVHGTISFNNQDIGGDFVILRSDGTPVYNMAVVSDDIAMRITVVMRGDDHISNTPKQILLYRALGAPLPVFAHLPMIHGTDGRKLSKRHGAMAVGDYQHMGIVPQAMVNFLALLGWSPGGDREIMTRQELIELFSVEGLLKKASVFDPQKLEWMNGQHLNLMPLEELSTIVEPLVVEAGLASREELRERHEWWLQLLQLLRVRARTTIDIVRQASIYFTQGVEYDASAVAKQWKDRAATTELLRAVRERIANAPWEAPSLEASLNALAEERGIGRGKLFQPLRVALTGQDVSPGIFDVLMVLGRERAVRRIDRALETLSGEAVPPRA
ncbi:MAG TPA: glutamate--tRNA ligase [Gemmatimonadaceae bacterium]